MLVKNTATGVKIDRDTAFIVNNGKKNEFYDSKEQYLEYLKNKELVKSLGNKYVAFMGKYVSIAMNPQVVMRMRRDIKLFMEIYPYEYIKDVLEVKNNAIIYAHETKSFTTPHQKYGYLFAIIKNQMANNLEAWRTMKVSQVKENVVSDTVMGLVEQNRGFKNEDISKFVKEDF